MRKIKEMQRGFCELEAFTRVKNEALFLLTYRPLSSLHVPTNPTFSFKLPFPSISPSDVSATFIEYFLT